MSQRISLTRIVALHWYGFRQILDVNDNVLISGAFGTGKSALLDLVQYVLLGEHWRANRAASGNKRGRDLLGYCLGDTNQTRNGQRHFLRQSGVTLVALEFTRSSADPKKAHHRETWGIRLQFTSPDAAHHPTYFYIPDRLEYADIAGDGKLLPDDAFRAWLRRDFGNDSVFSGQKDYLAEMATPRHLNFDALAFHRTFPKAIAFELEENVEKFIREFILEESPLDVREVRTALRAYEDTRKRLEQQEDEAVFLRRISEQHARHETSRREQAVLLHTSHSLKLLQAEERRDRHAAELQRLESEHADDLKTLKSKQSEAENVGKLLADVRFEIQQDPEGGKLDRLDRDKRELQEKVTAVRESQQSARQQLADRHYRWVQWLKHGVALPVEDLESLLVVDNTLLGRLHSGNDAERFEALGKLADQFNELWRQVEKLIGPLVESEKSTEKRLKQLAEDLDKLDRKQMPGAFPLFQAIRHKLGDRVEQLGRLIEVKPEAERWWPALELFLGRNRWVVIVKDDADYRTALAILRKVPPGHESESLLNPAEARQLRAGAKAASLFSQVEVIHPVARHYVEHLLGEVICVETIEELESISAGRAITPEGIFKQVPLRRRLPPAASVDLTLGREGLARMRAVKQKEQTDTRIALKAIQQQLNDVGTWLDQGRKGGLDNRALPDRAAEIQQLPELETQLQRARETLKLLMTPEREERQKRMHGFEAEEKTILGLIAIIQNRNQGFELKLLPERENLERAKAEIKTAQIDAQESRKNITGILDAELVKRRDQFRGQYNKWTECFDALRDLANKAGIAASEALLKRNNERHLLITVRDDQGNLRHPQYQGEFSTEDESNDRWDARLGELEQVELKKSRQLAADRKQEWERRLEENVLNELNRRITDAATTIRLLDRYLNQPIGKFRYRISQRKDTAGYGPLWSLLNSGLEATDPLAAAIRDGEVQRAKDDLMRAVNAPDQSDDRIRRLLDYRNYHHYDVEYVPADKPDAPPISLSLSGRNLSGGEGQVPFFICMLAAFRRVYDRGDRSSAKSQQLGLVLMDEAFSKLSGDGIEDCLSLARNFQLQLVMAFPPERLSVMVPHAQTVVMCQKEVESDKEGYVKKITNLPLITTMAEAMEALS